MPITIGFSRRFTTRPQQMSILAAAMGVVLVSGPPALASPPLVAMERVSVANDGSQVNANSLNSAISADGRFVAFDSEGFDLQQDAAGGARPDSIAGTSLRIYVRDRMLHTTEFISKTPAGLPANASCFYPTISANGRYVAFTSAANNLVAGDTNGFFDVFVRDRTLNTTIRASVNNGGSDLEGGGFHSENKMSQWMSSDGRYVVFGSTKKLTANATTSTFHLYRRDLVANVTELVSVDPGGMAVNNVSSGGILSVDGRFVMFRSGASDILPGIPLFTQIMLFVRDMQLGVTVSLTPHLSTADLCWNTSGDNNGYNLSGNGRFAIFNSGCTDIAPGQTIANHLFVRDLLSGTTSVLNMAQGGVEDAEGGQFFSIGSSGRYVVASTGVRLISSDADDFTDVFLRDRASGTTMRVSQRVDGITANGSSLAPNVSAAGHVVFRSDASNLVDDDTSFFTDIFVATLDPLFESAFE